MTEAGATSPGGGRNAYGWLPVCLDDQDVVHFEVCPTPELSLIPGHTATCANMTRDPNDGPPYHTIFTGPSGFSGLSALAVDNDPPIEEQDVMIVGELDLVSEFDCNANEKPDECDISACTPQSPDFPGCEDCNQNGIPDECDIAGGHSQDSDPPDGVPDECDCGPCPLDTPVSGPDGQVGPEDLAYILGNWGPITPDSDIELVCIDNLPPTPGNGNIGPEDLAKILGSWGPCP